MLIDNRHSEHFGHLEILEQLLTFTYEYTNCSSAKNKNKLSDKVIWDIT